VRGLAAAAAVVLVAAAGCGSNDGSGSGSGRLVVSAAASMTEALTGCSRDFDGARVRLSFAGSDELAAQVRQGAKPDVYAAANTKLPKALHDEGRLSTPVEFATNELVLAVPAGSGIHAVQDLARPGEKLAIGSKSVPVGSYTREVLSRLPEGQAHAILANVRSNEPDVKGVIGKLIQGAADAGFVYKSDVPATNGKLDAVELPARLQPTVTYAAGVVKGASEPKLARRYVAGLVSGRCGRALRDGGFGPPPK
jgi:molybdate transport system substrate-binding protein